MARMVITTLPAVLMAQLAIPARQQRRRLAICLHRAELAAAMAATAATRAVRYTVLFAVRTIAIPALLATTVIRAARC